MARCDICGCRCHAVDMELIPEVYQTETVSAVCKCCWGWVCKQREKARESVRQAIKKRCNPAPWWRRLFGNNKVSGASPLHRNS
jgi:hypothetical protein